MEWEDYMLTGDLQRLFFPPSLFSAAISDVEYAKRLYLSQFAHTGCGGSPVAYTYGGNLGCTHCNLQFPAHQRPLGIVLQRSQAFVSLIVGEA